jgi:hypothetical protein
MPMPSENNKRYHENAQLYRKRQEINEHILALKRQLQSHQFNGTRKVNGEHSLIMLVYNIKRSIILGVPDLIAKLKMELTWAKVLLLLKTSI